MTSCSDYFIFRISQSPNYLILKKSDNVEVYLPHPFKVYGIICIEGEYYEYSNSRFLQIDDNISVEELEELDQLAKKDYFEFL